MVRLGSRSRTRQWLTLLLCLAAYQGPIPWWHRHPLEHPSAALDSRPGTPDKLANLTVPNLTVASRAAERAPVVDAEFTSPSDGGAVLARHLRLRHGVAEQLGWEECDRRRVAAAELAADGWHMHLIFPWHLPPECPAEDDPTLPPVQPSVFASSQVEDQRQLEVEVPLFWQPLVQDWLAVPQQVKLLGQVGPWHAPDTRCSLTVALFQAPLCAVTGVALC